MVDKQFDAIVTDVTNLKYKRNPYLYTLEYFKLMDDALTTKESPPPGYPGRPVFEDLRVLVATFDKVYPHTTVWYFSQYPTHFVIAIGTPERT